MAYIPDRKKLGSKLDPNPHIISLILAAKAQGIKVGVATMSTRKRAEIILRRIGVWEHLDAFVTAEEVTKHRPDPEIYLLAASHMGVEPAECVAIDDAGLGVQA